MTDNVTATAMKKALKECETVMAMAEHPNIEDPDYGREVAALGDRIGFGALMSSASATWHKRAIAQGTPGSEFVASPCYVTLIKTLRIVRAAIALAEGNDTGRK